MALTPNEIDGLRELILAVYGLVTEELLRDLCRCITAAGQISSGDEYKLLLAKSLAGADDVIADTLRRQADLTDDAVEQLMRWAAEKTAPLEENESLRNIAEAYVKVTRKEVANVLGQLAAADVDGRVYPIKMYTGARWTMYSARYPAAQRRRRRLCGVPRCGCGSAASAPSTARTGALFPWSSWPSAPLWRRWAK